MNLRMKINLGLAGIAAATLLLSPSGHAEKEIKANTPKAARSERLSIKELTARAFAGNAHAQFALGIVYEEGRSGLKASLPDALSWYEEAARNGSKLASQKLRLLTTVVE